MDIKRTLLWVIFALSLLMLYNNWQQANGRAPLFGAAPASAPVAAGASDALPTAVAAAPAAAVASAPVGQLVTVTTDVYEAQVDTVGGTLVSLKLLRQQDKDGAPVQLFAREPGHQYLARSGLIGAAPLPNHTVVFAAQPGARELGARNEVALSLVAEQNGVKLVKTYVFKRGDYVIDVRFDVTNAGREPVAPTLYLELARDDKQIDASRFYSTFTGPAVYSDAEKFQKIKFESIAKGDAKYVPSIDANQPGWIGMVQHYFASAWIPHTDVKRDVYVDKIDANLYRVGVKQALGAIAPGATVTTDARLFAGPQSSHLLEQTAPGLELVKDYGWLTIIAKPLFWLLEKIHSLLGNWGWTIVLLTVLIKLAFFPLSAASYKSMAKMKELNPKLAALKEQHKGNPQQLNQAMMQLYRSEKVNPLGGCFPILIQIPVFIALYWVLLASVEMRHAPWVGWIHDLSAPDPYYVLPVLMAVSMFVQTRLNPTPPDPVQAKVMLIMPLAFSVMFFFFPAGMVLYWVINNILSIAQQWSINRMMGHKKA